jgi:hypothetical protein
VPCEPVEEEPPERPTDRLGGGTPKNFLRGGIKQYDALVFVHRHNSIHGRFEDARQPLFAISQLRFRPLPIGDVDEHRTRGLDVPLRASDWLHREADPELPAVCRTAFELLRVGFLASEKPLENLKGLWFAVGHVRVKIKNQPARQFTHAVSEQFDRTVVSFLDPAIRTHRQVGDRRFLIEVPQSLLSRMKSRLHLIPLDLRPSPRGEGPQDRQATGAVEHGFAIHDCEMPGHLAGGIEERHAAVTPGSPISEPCVAREEQLQVAPVVGHLAVEHCLAGRAMQGHLKIRK